MKQPSEKLLQLIRAYLEVVDSGDANRQGDERTRKHDALMEQMRAEEFEFADRADAREKARRLLADAEQPKFEGKWVGEMWAVTSVFAEPNDVASVIQEGTTTLVLSSDMIQESYLRKGAVLVRVTIECVDDGKISNRGAEEEIKSDSTAPVTRTA